MITVAVAIPVLQWAAERSGLHEEDLAKKFPKWQQWLRGDIQPSLRQLEAFAKSTHVPFGYFLLSEPPDEPLPISDFRTMPKASLHRPSGDLLDTIYLCQQRQAWYNEYQRLQAAEPLGYVQSVTIEDPVADVARNIAQVIGFSRAERAALGSRTDALRYFVNQAEQAGVLVMISGVVGSNTHRPLNPEEFRGFALADPLAPLIFINGKDSKAAQLFTLAHELAHIWLGESGVSDIEAATSPTEAVERWCNAVAAELLVPLEEIGREYRTGSSPAQEMQRLARFFKVSTLVILRRLHDLGVINRKTLWDSYREELERLKELEKEKKATGGGDFYNSLGARASKRFVRALVANTLEGQTQFTDAFRMLGIRKSATFYASVLPSSPCHSSSVKYRKDCGAQKLSPKKS